MHNKSMECMYILTKDGLESGNCFCPGGFFPFVIPAKKNPRHLVLFLTKLDKHDIIKIYVNKKKTLLFWEGFFLFRRQIWLSFPPVSSAAWGK